MAQLNLFLAFFWLVLGTGLLLWPVLLPGQGGPLSRSVGVVCLVFFGYNMQRWYLARLRRRYREEEHAARPRPRRRREPVHPEFDFSGDAPPPQVKPEKGPDQANRPTGP